MPVSTRKQLRDSILESTTQLNTQIGSLVNDFINITLQEISAPAWAFPNSNHHHLWSWLKRKTTKVATGEDVVLERDVDKIALIRQLSSPSKLIQITDEMFYKGVPNPTASGNPRFYRLWDIDGLQTRMSSSGLIDVLSSSSSDGSTFTITVQGYVSGILDSETYSLNGTSAVAGTKTWDAREIFVSKSGKTTGTITVRRNSNSSTLVTLGPEETSPRFKIISLYPIPTSCTLYIEYYKKIRELVNDSDCPEFDGKWHHVVRIGTIAKVYQYLGKVNDAASVQVMYEKAVRAMVADDNVYPDLVETMERRNPRDNADIIFTRNLDDIVV